MCWRTILIKQICLSVCLSVRPSICYVLVPYENGERWVNCPTRVGNLEASTVCWREATRRVQLSGNHAVLDRVHHVAVEDLVLSQEDKPKRYRWAREISHETANLYSSVHRKIIHGDLQLKCFKRRRAQLLSEASRISRLTDKQPYRLH